MNVKILIWKEGSKVLIRDDKRHINTFGNSIDDDLFNYWEAWKMEEE